ncbi:unnamed protein product [Oppiella nova]|uniref:RING-type domain-containing protein n=1 Tax=Oppiella nova TaxID=334625 RepID=A0A7R9MCN9_9ACAR|nr:unnamed protein product [Oppiella nova]CAG2174749.1 unnamed protein product [Oppiella nova]
MESSVVVMDTNPTTNAINSQTTAANLMERIEEITEEIVSEMSDAISDHSDRYGSQSPKKRLKTEASIGDHSDDKHKHLVMKDKLEHRLGGILCCAVCLDLPKSGIFQFCFIQIKCTNGHLMCAGCFTHLLADARLRDETATCPNCRCVISRDLCSRNLAVEKAVCELPGLCRFCSKELPRVLLDKHQVDYCEERIVRCTFARIGCPWSGPFHESGPHAETCIHPNKSGREVLDVLIGLDKETIEEKKLYDSIFDLLSFEKITFNDLQLKPYRTDEYIHKLYYETSRFTAFNTQWVVKARVNEDQRDPTQSCERQLSYQIVLKSKLTTPMAIHYVILKGPFGDMKLHPRLYKHEFNESSNESPFQVISLHDSHECNKLLAAKV